MDEQTATDSPETRLSNYFQAELGDAPAPKAAPPSPLQEAAPQEAQTTESEVEPQVPEDDGHEDFEVEGATYRIPRELKGQVAEWRDGYLRRDDYTKKTQHLADITRQAQALAETIQFRQAFESETQKDREELAAVTADLNRYKAVDWSNLEVETYIKLKGQMDALKDKASELGQKLNSKAQEFQTKAEQQKRKAAEEGVKYLQKAIPNFGNESVQSARSGAQAVGYTDNELENVYDARFVALSWKAAQYDKLQSGKASAVSAAQKAPPVLKPGPGMGQAASADKSYKDLRSKLKKSGSQKDAEAVFKHLYTRQ